MANDSNSSILLQRLEPFYKDGSIPNASLDQLKFFLLSYEKIIASKGLDIQQSIQIVDTYLKIVQEICANPPEFESYHRAICEPFDYYRFGYDFFSPLVDFKHSTLVGKDHLDQIASYIEQGENVILFGNHQIEPDPQAISMLIEKVHKRLAEEMIFVAGERVVTDPLALPLSLGRHLLCIYSKKYFGMNPSKRASMQASNKKTMSVMKELLDEGSKCIYIAPSGGRDRQNSEGKVEVAPFDPQSIELFRLIAKKSKRPTHFFPLALATYNLLPPPETTQHALGEERHTQNTPIHLAFGEEVDFDKSIKKSANREENKLARTAQIYDYVCKMYKKFPINY